jgi:hypothetical protein
MLLRRRGNEYYDTLHLTFSGRLGLHVHRLAGVLIVYITLYNLPIPSQFDVFDEM